METLTLQQKSFKQKSKKSLAEKYKILIAEDNDQNLLLIKHCLSTLGDGYEIITAKDGREALEKAKEQQPELVILDWEMPYLKGVEVSRILKENQNFSAIPIIMTTAKTASLHLEEAFQAGVTDYIKKPLDRIELISRVRSAIALSKSFKKIREQKREIEKKNELITDQNKTLGSYNVELAKMNKVKDKLFSVVSHDIKTPLNTLSSLLDVFIHTSDTFTVEELRQCAIDIKHTLGNVYGLLEKLLRWALSQMGKAEFEPEVYSVSNLVKDNIQLLEAEAKQKKIELSSKEEIETGEIFGDKNMLDFVIRNLVSNAIKFTNPGGKVELRVKEGKTDLKISIVDNGVGIEEERQRQLFKSEKVLTSVGTNQEKGTGLGLLLSKDYIEKNGGKIKVKSSLGEGSTFTFTIPKPDYE